jgi:hypothetical protein
MIYISLALVGVSLGIPLFFFFGKKLRQWTSGKVDDKKARSDAWERLEGR